MTHQYYVEMHTGGVSDPAPDDDIMYVYLYPYASGQNSAVQSGGIATIAVKDIAEQLLSYAAIDHYTIYRWYYETLTTKYPYWGDIDNCSSDGIKHNFKSYLKNSGDTNYCGTVEKNGTGDNKYNLLGCHLLIHGGATGCTETAGDYAPDGAGAEAPHDSSAFNDSKAAWAPICSDSDFTKAAVAQETLHTFIHPDYDGTNECDTDPSDHSLGTLNYSSQDDTTICTPMLTYHWDDFADHNDSATCPCPVDRQTTPDSHTLSTTTCTKDAVKNTANNH